MREMVVTLLDEMARVSSTDGSRSNSTSTKVVSLDGVNMTGRSADVKETEEINGSNLDGGFQGAWMPDVIASAQTRAPVHFAFLVKGGVRVCRSVRKLESYVHGANRQ